MAQAETPLRSKSHVSPTKRLQGAEPRLRESAEQKHDKRAEVAARMGFA